MSTSRGPAPRVPGDLPGEWGPAERASLAARIDHTLLRPDATRAEVRALCDEALRHGFAAVCVNPVWVEEAAAALARRAGVAASGAFPAHAAPRVAVCTVAGFPLGACTTATKCAEAAAAIASGAAEVDMVLQVGWLVGAVPRGGAAGTGGDRDVDRVLLAALRDEIAAVRAALLGASGPAPAGRRVLKVILETALLDERQKRLGALAAAEAGAHYVKTSTGFAGGGATAEDVRLLRRVLPQAVRIKASGGIRDRAAALALVAAGADRLGCSASQAIVGA